VQSTSYLALKSTLTGDALFDAFTRHCLSGNEHLVLVSRPFKSVTERVAGLPLLVRQVHMLTLLCSPVIITLTLRVLFSEKNIPTLSLALCVLLFKRISSGLIGSGQPTRVSSLIPTLICYGYRTINLVCSSTIADD
jgi:hypothetical protein